MLKFSDLDFQSLVEPKSMRVFPRQGRFLGISWDGISGALLCLKTLSSYFLGMRETCGCQALKGSQMCQMAGQIDIRWQPREKQDSPLKALLCTSLNDSHLPETSLDIRGKQHKSA